MEKILSIAAKLGDSAEVYRVTSSRTPVQFEANRLKQIQTKQSTVTALRIIKNGRVGFAQASGDIDAEDIVRMALDTSQFGYEVKFNFPAAQTYANVEVYDPAVMDISIDSMVSLGEKVISAVCENTPGVICDGSVSRSTATFTILNTSGASASYRRTNSSIGIEGMLVRDGDILYVGDECTSCRPVTDCQTLIEEIIRQLDFARNTATIKSGTYPVVFMPSGVAGALIAPLVSALNGKTVLDGASPLKDKLGKNALDTKFTLSDDPTLPYQPGSTPFDDEGIATIKNVLIDHGKVNRFYYDLHTAALAGTASTGNGSRNGGMPSPAPHALVINGGDTSLMEMVKCIKEGLVIEQLMGAEQGNILNGDFSGNVLLGYKIENGEVTGRVKDTMVFGNIYQLLKEITAMGNDTRWIGGFVNTPSIWCPAISVSSK